MKKYPLKLFPFCKEALWGGSLLYEKYGKGKGLGKAAESWELYCTPQTQNIIAEGEAKGLTLGEYAAAAGNEVLFPQNGFACFPLLIKFIGACDDLSVQVHPGRAAAKKLGGTMKNELWYIADCKEGAEIIYGTTPSATGEDIRRAILSGNISPLLRRVKVKPGDVFYIPAGLIHGLGKGITVAEIQQSSDTTYRIYDYDRTDSAGKVRQLHLKEASEAAIALSDKEIEAMRFSGESCREGCIASFSNFDIFKITVNGCHTLKASECFGSLICIDGKGKLRCESEDYAVRGGDTFFIPAHTPEIEIIGDMTLLSVFVRP